MARLMICAFMWYVMSLGVRAQVDPAQPGPYAVGILTTTIPSSTGNNLVTDIYYPQLNGGVNVNAAPYPVVVWLHGFQGSKAGLASVSRLAASYGMVSVTPSLVYSLFSPNQDERLEDAQAVLGYLARQRAADHTVLKYTLPDTAIAGHSAGGLTALMTAASDRILVSVLGLDPVLSGGMGNTQPLWDPQQAQALTAPTLLLLGPPQTCNSNNDNNVSVYPYLSAPIKSQWLIRGASHCDFIDSSWECELSCAATADSRRFLIRKYAIAWLNLTLRHDWRFYDVMYGAYRALEVGQNLISILMEQPLRRYDLTMNGSVDWLDGQWLFSHYGGNWGGGIREAEQANLLDYTGWLQAMGGV